MPDGNISVVGGAIMCADKLWFRHPTYSFATPIALILALAVGCAAFIFAPEVIPAAAILAAAWYLRRVYQVSVPGTVLCVVSLECVTAIVSIAYRSEGSIFELIPITLLTLTALAFMVASVLTFLIHGWISPVRRRQNLLAMVPACGLPLVWFAIGPRGAFILNEWVLQRELARGEVPAFIEDLSALSQRLGRVPRDEAELVGLLGKPIPRVSRGRIRYRACDGKYFSLGFGDDMGHYEFESQHPELGWHNVL